MKKEKSTIKKLKKLAPLLEISQRKGARGVMVGANTVLKLDGKPVRGAQKVSFEVDAKGIAKAIITIVGRFKVTGRPLVKQIKLYK
jgi:hypothetical protein